MKLKKRQAERIYEGKSNPYNEDQKRLDLLQEQVFEKVNI